MEFKTTTKKIGNSTFILVPNYIKKGLDLSDDLEQTLLVKLEVENDKEILTYSCVVCGHVFDSNDEEIYCPACGHDFNPRGNDDE